MAVGEVWHFKVHVASDGTASDVVAEFPAGSYLVLAKASFLQDPNANYASDSSGTLGLLLDDGESEKWLEGCTAQFGGVEASVETMWQHYGDEWTQSGTQILGLKGGVAVINALVSIDATSTLKLQTSTQNARVEEGAMSVMECSVPPRRAPGLHPGGVSPASS